jgi:hypothetical protein
VQQNLGEFAERTGCLGTEGKWSANSGKAFRQHANRTDLVNEPGLPIQRDHINKKAALIAELLSPSADLDAVIERAQCCVVSEEEHRRLGAVSAEIDGWERYRAAGISVF